MKGLSVARPVCRQWVYWKCTNNTRAIKEAKAKSKTFVCRKCKGVLLSPNCVYLSNFLVHSAILAIPQGYLQLDL